MTLTALLPYQAAWAAEQAEIAVYEKSRRIGASWAEACISTLMASRAGRDGCDILYCCYNEDATRTFISDCAFWAKTFQLAASKVQEDIIRDEGKDILAFRITFASGYEIKALSSNPVNIRGKAGRVIIDEAGHVPDLEAMVNAAIALLMWGGQIRIIGTHNGKDSSFNMMIEKIKAGQLKYALHTTTLDDALADGLYQRICLIRSRVWSQEAQDKWRQDLIDKYLDPDTALEELFCIPTASSKLFFSSLLIESRMRSQYQVTHLKLPDNFIYKLTSEKHYAVECWLEEEIKPALLGLNPDERHYIGEDFGRDNDLSVFAVIAEQSNVMHYCPLLIELKTVPFDQQAQILGYIIRRLPRFAGGAMDARGNGQWLAEWAANNFGHHRIAQLKMSDTDYGELVPIYKKALEDGTFYMPKNANVLADHQAVRLINGIAKVPRGVYNTSDTGERRHGDSFVALLLGLAAATKHPVVTQDASIQTAIQVNSRREARGYFNPTGHAPTLTIGRAAAKGIFS